MRIKEMRVREGMTQADLAESLNVKSNTVSQWENELRTPRADKLLILAKIFQCTVDELLKEE